MNRERSNALRDLFAGEGCFLQFFEGAVSCWERVSEGRTKGLVLLMVHLLQDVEWQLLGRIRVYTKTDY